MSHDGTFRARYARSYDAIYVDKRYDVEVATLVSALQTEGVDPGSRVLDLGCGTGRHARGLADAGYTVTAVDRSEQMLAIARERCANAEVALYMQDIEELELAGPPHDAAVLMFNVLGYLVTDARVARALAAVRRHVRPGAPLIADIWNEAAVAHEAPAPRRATFEVDGQRFTRSARTEHHRGRGVCTVRYEIRDELGELASEETHVVRYFEMEALRSLLSGAGFSLVRASDWPDLDAPPTVEHYAACVVARAT